MPPLIPAAVGESKARFVHTKIRPATVAETTIPITVTRMETLGRRLWVRAALCSRSKMYACTSPRDIMLSPNPGTTAPGQWPEMRPDQHNTEAAIAAASWKRKPAPARAPARERFQISSSEGAISLLSSVTASSSLVLLSARRLAQVLFLPAAFGLRGFEGLSSVRNKASVYSRAACRTKFSLIIVAHNKK
jgi:hypothetical protein